jgi:hypothetical protein
VKGDRLPISEHYILEFLINLFAVSCSGEVLAINPSQQASSGLKSSMRGIRGHIPVWLIASKFYN